MAEDFDFLSQMESIGRPTVVKKPWMETKKFVLVTNETLPTVVDECIKSGLYALDLETTGLDSRVFDGRTVDSISGACLSPDGEVGYYIPVQHPEHKEACVSYSLFKSEMRRLVDSPAIAIFHNGKFDQDFLQFCGGEPIGEWDDPKKWEDTLILAYLRNTRAKEKGLKFLSKTELGMEMIELDELFTDEQIEESGKDFGKLDPRWEPVLLYAASDAICTYLLFKKIRDEAIAAKAGLPSQEAVYFLEKQCVAATRWMERNRVPVNRDGIAKLIKLGLDEWLPALSDVYEASSKIFGRDVSPGYFKILTDPKSPLRFSVDDPSKTIMDYVDAARIEAARRQMDPIDPSTGKIKTIDKVVQTLKFLGSEAKWDPKKTETVSFPVVYDILVEEQIGNLFREMGIPGLLATAKSGQVKTSMDVIEGILEEYGEDYPYLKKIKRFRNVRKAISTYLMPIYEFTDPKYSPDGRMRINFEAFKIDTARFCTPAGKSSGKFSGRVPLNFHSLPSGKGKDIPVCLKGVRTTIEAEEGYMIVAVDFSAEELRIVTNLSGEPMWEREFFRCGSCKHEFDRSVEALPPPPEPPPPFCPKCGSDNIGDLHTLTAIALYGEEIVNDPQFKTYRGYAKGTNFALCYGGGGQAVVRAAGTTLEEGWRIVRKFTGAYKGLARWWATQVDFAKKHGCVLTAFNRRYPLPDIYNENGFFQKKAERNAVNGPIQGSGSDLIKYAMGMIYKECKKRGWLNLVRMILTMHDELVFEIHKSVMEPALDMIKEVMVKKTISRLRWRVPLTCDIECGPNYSVPMNVTRMWYGVDPIPNDLKEVFHVRFTKTGDVLPPTVSTLTDTVETQQVEQTPHPEPPPPEENPRVQLKKGETHTYTIPNNKLTMTVLYRVGQIVAKCRGRGTHPLIIKTDAGYVIMDDSNVMVNPLEFDAAMSLNI